MIGAVSGGVDSTVAAKLMHEAIGERLVFRLAKLRVCLTDMCVCE